MIAGSLADASSRPSPARLERRLCGGEARLRPRDRGAQRAGETEEEIAHADGYTVPMIRATTPAWRMANPRPAHESERRLPGGQAGAFSRAVIR
jgi:hypothetical protein